jgi:hypothetical protein
MAWLSGRGVPSRAQAFEFSDHGRILNGRRIDITNARFRHRQNLPEEIVAAPGVGCSDFQLMTDVDMLPQHQRRSNGTTVFR